MFKKFLLFILICCFNLKIAFSTDFFDKEKMNKNLLSLICNYLDMGSFTNLMCTSKSMKKRILNVIEDSEKQNEKEVDILVEKFRKFLVNQEIGTSVEEYFRLFSFERMNKQKLDSNKFPLKIIEDYQKIEQNKTLNANSLIKFGRLNKYGELNTKIYNCFYEDFKKRAVKFNGEAVDRRKQILLHHENINFLSPCIREFKNITDLYLFHNELHFIPKEIGNCIYLKYIDLSNNKIESIPAQIANCQVLETIILRENPQLNILKTKQLFNKNPKLKIEF